MILLRTAARMLVMLFMLVMLVMLVMAVMTALPSPVVEPPPMDTEQSAPHARAATPLLQA